MTELLTVCIVHYNKVNKLKKTVTTLQESTGLPVRLKLLNNGYEDDEIRSYLADLEREDWVEVIYNDENVGCPPGRHQLLREIRTPYAMTLDDDMYVEDGWLERILELFEADADIGVVGVPYVNAGTGSRRGGARITLRSNVLRKEDVDWETVPGDRSYVRVDHVPGGTMVFRRELLEEFDWDPQFFVGMGDFDKSLQIMHSEWDQVMATGVEFEHDVSRDEDYRRVRKDYREIRRSYGKFVAKWGYRYPLRRHLIFNYFFRLPWSVMNPLEAAYQRTKRLLPRTVVQ